MTHVHNTPMCPTAKQWPPLRQIRLESLGARTTYLARIASISHDKFRLKLSPRWSTARGQSNRSFLRRVRDLDTPRDGGSGNASAVKQRVASVIYRGEDDEQPLMLNAAAHIAAAAVSASLRSEQKSTLRCASGCVVLPAFGDRRHTTRIPLETGYHYSIAGLIDAVSLHFLCWWP